MTEVLRPSLELLGIEPLLNRQGNDRLAEAMRVELGQPDSSESFRDHPTDMRRPAIGGPREPRWFETAAHRNNSGLRKQRVSTAVGEEEIGLEDPQRQLVEIEKQVREATSRHNGFLTELGLSLLRGSD